MTVTSGTVLTFFTGVSAGTPCKFRVNDNIFTFSATATCTITAGSGSGAEAKALVNNAGTLVVEYPSGAGLSVTGSGATCSSVSTPAFPDGSHHLAGITVVSGAWTTLTADRPQAGSREYASAGNGIGAISNGVISIDGTVPQLGAANTFTAKNIFSSLFNGGVDAQSGTSYTVTTADENKLLTFNNGSATAVTLPQATTAGFIVGAVFTAFNRGAGAVTITPTISTINGAATLVLNQNQGAYIVSDGTNYSAWVSSSPSGSGTVTSIVIAGTANQITASGTCTVTTTGTCTLSIPTNPVFSGTALTFPGALSITSGKTLTISNSFTATATDSATLAIGAGGTIEYTHTARVDLLDNMRPDNSGNATYQPAADTQTNDRYPQNVGQFIDTGTKDCLGFRFTVPGNYSAAPVFRVIWTSTATSGNAIWDVDYSSAANTASLDPSADEEAVTATTAAPGSSQTGVSSTMAATAGNFAIGDVVQGRFCRDGASADTIAAALVVYGLTFEYTTK